MGRWRFGLGFVRIRGLGGFFGAASMFVLISRTRRILPLLWAVCRILAVDGVLSLVSRVWGLLSCEGGRGFGGGGFLRQSHSLVLSLAKKSWRSGQYS